MGNSQIDTARRGRARLGKARQGKESTGGRAAGRQRPTVADHGTARRGEAWRGTARQGEARRGVELTDDCYERLRAIGASVETADALAPIIAGLSSKKREAFYLWTEGKNNCEVAILMGMNEITVRRLIKYVKGKCRKYP